jgi:hypothetical protein
MRDFLGGFVMCLPLFVRSRLIVPRFATFFHPIRVEFRWHHSTRNWKLNSSGKNIRNKYKEMR